MKRVLNPGPTMKEWRVSKAEDEDQACVEAVAPRLERSAHSVGWGVAEEGPARSLR